jgi:hypothetical protein
MTTVYGQKFDFGHTGVLEFKDTIKNFGTIKDDIGVVSYDFKFDNLGPEAFVLEEVIPSCGCITPEFSEDTIHAGEQGHVKIYLDVFNKSGLVTQYITIKGNSLKSPIHLYLEGFVTPGERVVKNWNFSTGFNYKNIWFEKNYIQFGSMLNNEFKTSEIQIYNNTNAAIKLSSVQADLPSYLKVALVSASIPSKSYGSLKVSFNPNLLKNLGVWSEQIDLMFEGEIKNTVSIVCSANVNEYFTPAQQADPLAPKLSIVSNVIDFGTLKEGEVKVLNMVLTNTGGKELLIKQINTSCSCVEAFTEKQGIDPTGGVVNLSVSIDTTDLEGAQQKQIILYTNDPSQPFVKFFVKALIQ